MYLCSRLSLPVTTSTKDTLSGSDQNESCATMSESTEIATVSANTLGSEIANMSKGQLGLFTTITGDSFEDKAAIMNALSNSEPLSENLKATIQLANVVVESVDMANEQTGEIAAQPRIVLIDANGNAFHAISGPAFRDVKRLLAIMGHPSSWPTPLPIHVAQEGTGTRKYFTVKLGEAPKK